jgi:8-oxo-dGTP pyrophosphatase MutT (NUDIX family)
MTDPKILQDISTPFYRVAVKVLIMDELGRLLVEESDKGLFEIPGGGWEYDETLEQCVRRELQEELGADVHGISDVEFVLRGHSHRYGWRTVRLVVRASLDSTDLKPNDRIVAYRYVNRNEFAKLAFDPHDEEFATAADKIWSE